MNQSSSKIVAGVFLLMAGMHALTAAATITGYVTEAGTARPLAYANVLLKSTGQGTTTDPQGYYVLNDVTSGAHRLIISYMGYGVADTTVFVDEEVQLRLDRSLRSQSLEMPAVVISAHGNTFDQQIGLSRMNMSPRDLSVVPSLAEADIFRSLQALPGVVSQNDFSSSFIVRGGSPDENLILLDGIEVYNPYHFGGIFSAFNPGALGNANFQTGGFPVAYGGRLSSVLEIQTREGRSGNSLLGKSWPLRKLWNISRIDLDVSMLTSRASLEGPLYRGSYFISVRRTYLDQLSDLAHTLKDTIPDFPYSFDDIQWKTHTRITPRHSLDIQGYAGQDDLTLQFGEQGARAGNLNFQWIWGNAIVSAHLKSVLHPDLMLETTVASSQYGFEADLTRSGLDSVSSRVINQHFTDYNVDLSRSGVDSSGQGQENHALISNGLRDITLSERLGWEISSACYLQTGLEYKRFRFRSAFDNNGVRMLNNRDSPSLLSFYMQNTWTPGPLLNFRFGGRMYSYPRSDRPWFDLRGNVSYRLLENTTVTGSIGLYTQFLFTTNEEGALLRTADLWHPVPEYLDPQRAVHYIAGISHRPGNRYQLEAEAYYKPYLNLLDLNPAQNIYDKRDDYRAGTGLAWGVETLIRRTAGVITGWMSYAYAHVIKRVDLNGNGALEPELGEVYHPKYDIRHNFNLVLNYRLHDKHRFGIRWKISSGQPYTPVIGKYFGGNDTFGWYQPYAKPASITGKRNSARYPPYVRGDLSYRYQFQWLGGTGALNIQIINFTNYFNVLYYQWEHSGNGTRVKAFSMFPVIPTLGISYRI